MGHTIRLINYVHGMFATGISDYSKLALSEKEEIIYICKLQRKPNFNHVAMKIRIVTYLNIELIRDTGDRRVARDRELHNRHLQEARIWVQILEKRIYNTIQKYY